MVVIEQSPDFGLHVLLCLPSWKLQSCDRRLLQLIRPVGLHLRAQNFLPTKMADDNWLAALTSLLEECRQICGRPRMLVALDHEGGNVHRLPAPFSHFPTANRWGERTADVARVMARELGGIGVNLLFGPVADVHSNPDNPVIGPRAFAKTAEQCAKQVQIFVRHLRAGGVLGCLKHFPGHGDTLQDSHDELPVVHQSIEELLNRELLPFRAGWRSGAEVVMSAHVKHSALDSVYPATLSSQTLRALLRRKLGFGGVLISDDMDMKALSDNYPLDHAVLAGFRAGIDLFLFNHHPERAQECARILERAVKSGELGSPLFRESRARLQTLLSALPAPGKLRVPMGSDKLVQCWNAIEGLPNEQFRAR